MVNKIDTISVSELSEKEITPIPNLVDEILPKGLVLLTADPKVGKSYLTLQMCMCLSLGKKFLGEYSCNLEGGKSILYLANEDNEGRLKERSMQIANELDLDLKCISNLHFYTEPMRLDGEDKEKLDYLIEEKNVSLVVTDLLANAFPRLPKIGNIYNNEMDMLQDIKRDNQKRDISMLLVHHTNKNNSSDKLQKVSGTRAMTGGPDTLWFLEKKTEESFILSVTGKDVMEKSIKLKRENVTFEFEGYNEKLGISPEQLQIYKLFLKDKEKTFGTGDIAKILCKKSPNVSQLLSKLKNKGMIQEAEYGIYKFQR